MIGLWDIDREERIREINVPNQPRTNDVVDSTSRVAFSPDGRLLAFSTLSHTIIFWDLEANAVVHTLDTGLAENSVVFSPDGNVAIVAGMSAYESGNAGRAFIQAQAWDIAANQLIGLFSSLQDRRVNTLALSPDGSKLAVGGENAVRIWRVRDGRLIQVLQAHASRSIAFSPDGQLLASGGVVYDTAGTAGRKEANLLLWKVQP
jgi:WD40 repeat protein